MKCQSLFSGKNNKNIIKLSSAEFALRGGNVSPILCDAADKINEPGVERFLGLSTNCVSRGLSMEALSSLSWWVSREGNPYVGVEER